MPTCFRSNPSPQDQAEYNCATCPVKQNCLEVSITPATHQQSRSKSLLETVTSTAIGFVVSLLLTAAVMPAFGYPTTWSHDFWITVIFTVASIVRGYGVRRWFNLG